MISAHIVLDDERNFYSFEARGHADAGPDGHDLICAAFSHLAWSVGEVLQQEKIIRQIEAHSKGHMFYQRTGPLYSAKREWLHGVTAMLLWGVRKLAFEYPNHIQVEVSSVIR